MKADLLISHVLNEGKYVYRVDPRGIDIDHDNLRTYEVGNWGAGPLGKRKKAAPGSMHARGLFAFSQPGMAALYSVPRDVDRIAHLSHDGSIHVAFRLSDKKRIQNHQAVERTYDDSTFRRGKSYFKRSTGERFSNRPSPPLKIKPIESPIEHLKSHGWNIRFVKDLEAHHNQVKTMRDKGKIVDIMGEVRGPQWK
jgi:hypothetical protein